MAECFDRIHLRGTAGRIDAKSNAGKDRDQKG
jgi:hypothetical protein